MSEIKNHYTNKKAPKYNMSDICGKQISTNTPSRNAHIKKPDNKVVKKKAK